MKLFILFALCASLTASARTVTAPKDAVFRSAIIAKIPTIDPAIATDVYGAEVGGLFFETLYEYNYVKRPLELKPLLAAELPKMSKDFKTLTIKLKKGVMFIDDACFPGGKGREFKASDVIYMMERIADKKTGSQMFGSFDGKVVGFSEFNKGTAKTISGIKALDDYTVEFKLATPSPRFAFNFVDQKTGIAPKEAVEKYGDQLSRHPVGTGAWLPVSVDLNQKIVAKRNPNYKHMTYPSEGSAAQKAEGLLADAGKALPFLDRVEFEIVIEDQPRWLKFMSGEFDASGIPKDNYATAMPGGKISPELAQMGVKHYKEPLGDVTVQIFNMEDPVWGKKKELRQAFALAVNWPDVIEGQYSGQAIRAHSILDPTQYGYEASYKSKWADRNVAKAKELIAKAGYPNGQGLPPLVMLSTSGTTSRQFDERIQRHLKEAGITLQVDEMTWPEMMRRVHEHNFTMVGMAYGSSVPDADDATGIIHSKNIATGYNVSNYRNPEIDKLVDEIEIMANGPARMKKIRRMKEILDDELPIVVGVHRIGNSLVHSWVRNYVRVEEQNLGTALKYRKVIPAGK